VLETEARPAEPARPRLDDDGLSEEDRRAERHFDLAVLDPPYAYDGWPDVLAALDAEVAVLESDRPIEPGMGWSVARSRSYGTTVVTICRRSVADSQETAP